jgi:hypothetical protein
MSFEHIIEYPQCRSPSTAGSSSASKASSLLRLSPSIAALVIGRSPASACPATGCRAKPSTPASPKTTKSQSAIRCLRRSEITQCGPTTRFFKQSFLNGSTQSASALLTIAATHAEPDVSLRQLRRELAGGGGLQTGSRTMDDADMVAWPIAVAISATTFVVGLGALIAVVVITG